MSHLCSKAQSYTGLFYCFQRQVAVDVIQGVDAHVAIKTLLPRFSEVTVSVRSANDYFGLLQEALQV